MATPILLDSHALLWWLAGDRRLPERSRVLIGDPSGVAWVSAASAWEISVKRTLGKLEAPEGILRAAVESGLVWIPIEPHEAEAAGALPMHHRDPFDRLLVAQALARSATLLSRDEALDDYDVPRVWS